MKHYVIICKGDSNGYTASIQGEDGEYQGGSPDESIGYLMREALWLGGLMPCVITNIIRQEPTTQNEDIRMIRSVDLERKMRIAKDTKKAFALDKVTGDWRWHDRDAVEDLSGLFPTFFEALCDAVEPYEQASEDADAAAG